MLDNKLLDLIFSHYFNLKSDFKTIKIPKRIFCICSFGHENSYLSMKYTYPKRWLLFTSTIFLLIIHLFILLFYIFIEINYIKVKMVVYLKETFSWVTKMIETIYKIYIYKKLILIIESLIGFTSLNLVLLYLKLVH